MLNEIAKRVNINAHRKGYYDDGKAENIGERCALIHSEVSEALEADRKDRYCKVYINPENYIAKSGILSNSFLAMYEEKVKGTFEEEMADIIIRVLDMCAFKEIDIDSHLELKMMYNELKKKDENKKY